MLVSLTPKEVAQCNQAAAMRWQLARASGVVNQRRDKGRSDADLDLLGVKAELAVSKVFDLDHIHAAGVDDGRDVWLDDISIDVKATFYPTGRLLFKKREAFKADCSILVCQQAPDRMHVVGYIPKTHFWIRLTKLTLATAKVGRWIRKIYCRLKNCGALPAA